MIRKDSNEFLKRAIVEIGGADYAFVSVSPETDGDLRSQTLDAVRTLDAAIRCDEMNGEVVRQTIFLRDGERSEECRRVLHEFYGPEIPAVSFVPQTPCDGKEIVIEAAAINCGRDAKLERLNENVAVVRHAGLVWAHCEGILPGTTSLPVYDRSLDAFQRMNRKLGEAGMQFSQTVRTWLYLGDIDGGEGDKLRYQELNRARGDFFAEANLYRNFPASTGIGADGSDVMMGCVALASDRKDVVRLSLENPRQVAAHDYDDRYGRTPPKFSRATAILVGQTAEIFISGTASITASESRREGDVVGQTQETLDNILALVSAENFRRHGQSDVGASLDDLVSARVYVKRRDDYRKVREICRERLGDVPTIFTVADVCRDELLVEIEGIAVCRR